MMLSLLKFIAQTRPAERFLIQIRPKPWQ